MWKEEENENIYFTEGRIYGIFLKREEERKGKIPFIKERGRRGFIS